MILFKSVSCRNFFSVGNTPIKILLNRSQTTLVAGANGSGKSSTILDSINFALFGKPFRNINKPAVINSINQGDCVVEIDFQIGSKEYKVIRGMKPTIFEIYENGKMINQDAAARDYQAYLEENILCGLNEKVFKQVVVIGSADYKPFMQLPAASRREVIEELLDIKIFSQMLTLAKEKIVNLRDTLKTIDYDIELQQEKINIQKENKKRLKEQAKEKKESLLVKITEEETVIESIKAKIADAQKRKEELVAKSAGHKLLIKSIADIQSLSSGLNSAKNNAQNTLKFFNENDDCPTCHQGIPHAHKETIVGQSNKKLEELVDGIKRVEVELEKKNHNLSIFDKIVKMITKLEKEIYQWQSDISSHQKYINALNGEIADLNSNKAIVSADDTLKDHEDNLLVIKNRRLELIEERQYYELASDMLKDGGIKTKIIKQYVPIMNKIINDYLVRFELPIEFTLNGQFEETIKSRYRDSFQYNNFSEGEKQRIDTALLLAWRQIARAKNTTNCNILIMDETFDSSLDSSATEELLNILLEMDKNTNIFIMSHKSDLGDKLRSTITFEKHNNFTRIVS